MNSCKACPDLKLIYADSYATIYHADSLLVMEDFDDEHFDCIITDPAYWTLDKHRNTGTTTRLGGHSDPEKQSGWFETIDDSELWEFMNQCERVLKNNSHCYIMCDGQTLRAVLGYAEECFKNFKPIVWDKVHQGMGYHYRCRHEYFVMLDKGKNRRLNSLSVPDVWRVPMIRGGYPTEKPVELMRIPIENSTSPNEIILDPFMGGGSVLVAAKQLGRRAVGIDKNLDACHIAAERLAQTMVGV